MNGGALLAGAICRRKRRTACSTAIIGMLHVNQNSIATRTAKLSSLASQGLGADSFLAQSGKLDAARHLAKAQFTWLKPIHVALVDSMEADGADASRRGGTHLDAPTWHEAQERSEGAAARNTACTADLLKAAVRDS